MTSRSRSSGSSGGDTSIAASTSTNASSSRDRAAVDPIAALVALVAVGAALGLYTVALDDAAPDDDRKLAETTLDRVEREAAVGGVVRPDRLDAPTGDPHAGVAVEVRTRTETWRVRFGDDPPTIQGEPTDPTDAVAERTVIVRTAPGENVRGTLRVVVRR